ncbi:sigma-70 family RNA polymerase sigma factor [Solibacillus sp. FSL R7-0668]|uniref:sigma-70 family RNA polymerase sigma factor n=1 Tax=Solibacillus sp. FSL R7-0668 TaxID=2921688 RepID=UPI0030F7DB28
MAGQGQMDIGYMIGEYRFWKKEIMRLESVMWGGYNPSRSEGVAQYGIEAVMPKGSLIRSARELDQMDARERIQYKRWEKLSSYIYALDCGFEILREEKLQTIYDCLLDGMTYRQIAEHLNTSKDFVRIKRNQIISQISQNSQIRAMLTPEKTAV